ncbi:MAG: hypothetical protein ACRDSE_05410 [Pseudonocardiaceae bacterium]
MPYGAADPYAGLDEASAAGRPGVAAGDLRRHRHHGRGLRRPVIRDGEGLVRVAYKTDATTTDGGGRGV